MKKTTALFTLLLLALFLWVGCQPEESNGAATNPPSTEPTSHEPTYTITWINENGQMLETTTVKKGEVPLYSYSVSDTVEWDYTFQGWAVTANGEVLSSIPAATENASYYACVSSVKQKYTVTFHSNGGSAVASQTVEYGSQIVLPTDPTYEGHRFVGWSTSQNGTDSVDFTKPITGNVDYYAVWNKAVNVKAYFAALLNGYELNPFEKIPESMRADFADNLVDADELVSDYSGFVNVSDIRYGFGEQWHMVVENLEQSKLFFNVLSVVEGLSSTSVAAFNNYFDSNPDDTAHHEFASGIYSVTVNFDGRVISYVIEYVAEFPALGEQTVQIALWMDVETGEKNARIQLGDANALAYKITENSYEFAIKYFGVRRAMFTVETNEDGTVSGKIYEYLTDSVASTAEFYITEDYVSVVGNKADGMVGFSGYICELYDVETGRMLGYEVQETLSLITYNTLWFNLEDVDGIYSIKYQPKNGENPAVVFVNGSSVAWEAKKVGGLGSKMLSRRFDIEFRTQYVYSYDSETGKYVQHKIDVPMLFVQEEYYDAFASDVLSTNRVAVEIDVEELDLEQLLADYDELIPEFIERKDEISSDTIVDYIGEKITF